MFCTAHILLHSICNWAQQVDKMIVHFSRGILLSSPGTSILSYTREDTWILDPSDPVILI